MLGRQDEAGFQKSADLQNLASVYHVMAPRRANLYLQATSIGKLWWPLILETSSSAVQTSAQRFDTTSASHAKFEPDAVTLQDQGMWPGLRLEQWEGFGGVLPETVLSQHGMLLNLETMSSACIRWAGGRSVRGDLAPGSFGIFPAEHPYSGSSKGYWRGLAVGLAPEFVQSVFAGPAGAAVELIPGGGLDDGFVQQTCLALASDVRDRYPCGPIYGETLAIGLAVHLRRRYAADPRFRIEDLSASDPRKLRIQQYILDQLHERLALAEMAGFAQIDVYQFARWFKRSFGMPPHQYVLTARIGRAKELLRSSPTSLVDVALQCGFNSQSHLASTFRRLVGVAPGVYRNLSRH